MNGFDSSVNFAGNPGPLSGEPLQAGLEHRPLGTG
jgi:hypothetical protein